MNAQRDMFEDVGRRGVDPHHLPRRAMRHDDAKREANGVECPDPNRPDQKPADATPLRRPANEGGRMVVRSGDMLRTAIMLECRRCGKLEGYLGSWDRGTRYRRMRLSLETNWLVTEFGETCPGCLGKRAPSRIEINYAARQLDEECGR